MEQKGDMNVRSYTKNIPFFLAIFFTLRLLSWTLIDHPLIEGVIVFCLVMYTALLYFQHPKFAWYMVLGELVLGGSGHLLELWTLSLRTLMVYTFLFLWAVHSLAVKEYRYRLRIPHWLFYSIAPLFLFVIISGINGIIQHHPIANIIRDMIPFTYLFLLLPAYHLFDIHNNVHPPRYLIALLIGGILGTALYSLILFFLFSFGIEHLHDPFYNWIRDVGAGKITDMGTGFFRVVFPEHLLLPVAVLVTSSLLLNKHKKHHHIWYVTLAAALLVLVLNFSRAYLLGILVGFIVLLYRHNVKRWIQVAFLNLVLFLGIFFTLHLIGSGGQSLGLSLLGIRTQSFIQPQIEESTYTRMSLLSPIITMTQNAPLLGQGLGASLTFYNPISNAYVTTTQFDWGYLELWAELGIFGLLNIILLLLCITIETIIHIRRCNDFYDLHVGILAAIVALSVIAIFAPVFSHVLGIVLIVCFLALIAKSSVAFEYVRSYLAQLFPKKAIQAKK